VRSEDEIVGFSSVGPTKDGRIKPEVYCIGSDVASAASDTSGACPSSSGRPETVELSGTSMATPACAGAAALVREYVRKGYYPSGAASAGDGFVPSAALVKGMLVSSATVRPLTHRRMPLATTPSKELGFGRVDLSQVLRFDSSQFQLKLVDRHTVEHGAFRRYLVTSSGPFRVTLVWTDPPSYPSAERNLVNDLDLVVVRPGGAQLRGNDFAGTGQADTVNNVEHVTVPSGDDGQHQVFVYGTELNWFPQSQAFALVIAGSFVDDQQESAGTIDGMPARDTDTCSGVVTLTEATGSLSVGSAAGSVLCQWIIAPPDVTLLTVTLDQFATQGYDLEIFQCVDAQCTQKELLGRSSGGDSGTVSSFTGVILVRLSSDGATTGSGFSLAWESQESAEQCEGVVTLTEETGEFESALPYANGLSCSWIIAPTDATSVELTFTRFGTEENYDFVRVFECEGEGTALAACQNSKRVVQLSGSIQTPRVVTVRTGAMRVSFNSDESQVALGFAATWAAGFAATNPDDEVPQPEEKHCTGSQTFTDPSGTLEDGSGTADYGNNVDCEWIIAPAGAPGVSIQFSQFETEQDYDVVRIYECQNEQCPDPVLLAELSGSRSGQRVQTSTGVMRVVLTSDDSVSSGGFSATWGLVSAPCTGMQTLTDQSGSFADGSGVAYTNDLNCEWIIAPQDAGAVELTFSKFETEEGYDFVTIFNCADGEACVNTTQVAGLSGFLVSGQKVQSSTGVMRVVFTSDYAITYGGFAASWIAKAEADPITDGACSGTVAFTEASGSLEDGSGAGPYANNLECIWTIEPPGAQTIELVFSEFETEEGFDYVVVFECADTDCSELIDLAFLSGSQEGTTVRSNRGKVFIVFVSDESTTGPGFAMSWTSSTEAAEPQCTGSQTLTETSGTVEDGSGAALYQNDLNCEWIIAPLDAVALTLEVAIETEEGFDFVEIYECETEQCQNPTLLVDQASGILSGELQSSTGVVKIVFTSDDSVSSQGFQITWALFTPPTPSCSGQQTLTDPSGTLEDGSGDEPYTNNLECTWIIAPSGATHGVALLFSSISTEEGYDGVETYNCETEECLDAERTNFISGSLGEGSTTGIISPTGVLKVVFTSDFTTTGQGFSATWGPVSAPCTGLQTLTGRSGSFEDGSGMAYANDMTCEWIIAPPDALSIELTFSEFATEEGFDFVTVFECTDGEECLAPTFLSNFSGVLGPTTVRASTRAIRVVFASDLTITSGGFSASWTSANEDDPDTPSEPEPTDTPAPAAKPALQVVSTLVGVTAAQLRANLGGFRTSVASLHVGVSADDVVVDEESIADVPARRRRLLADSVSVAYEIQFEDRAAADAAVAVQENGATALQQRLVTEGFTDLQSITIESVAVSDPAADSDIVTPRESSAPRGVHGAWAALAAVTAVAIALQV